MRAFIRLFFRSLAVIFLCSTTTPVLMATVILTSFIFLPLPANIPEAKPLEAGQVSHVYDQNGDEIGQFREFEQNIPINPADIPIILKQAVISAEDKRFYSHGGIDVKGSVRALYADLRGNKVVQGGSTITQQYVKNAYVGKQRTLVRKVREAVIASQIDRQYKKDDVLFRYLSTIYLGNGAYGVGAGSETYFRKPVNQITLSEAALLAGLIPAPSRFEPRANPKLADERRIDVLRLMLEQGYIDKATHDDAVAQHVFLASQGKPPGPATVVYSSLQTSWRYPYFVDYVRRYLIDKYGPEMVDRGGLKIQTTLNPKLQDEAEKSVGETLKGTVDPLEMSLVAVEPPTGFVKALVGGRDFYNGTYANLNLALGGCNPSKKPTDPKIVVEVDATCWNPDAHGVFGGGGAGRQTGSAFKPFVLATALSKGVSPSKVYPAPNVLKVPNCKPTKTFDCNIHNNEGEGGGSVTLRVGIQKSINTVFAQLVRDVGCKDTGEMAKKLGISAAWYSPSVHTCSGTYALGVLDVSPLDMSSAYGVFANRGVRQEPVPVVLVADSKGKILEDNRHRDGTRVLDEVVADNMNDMLRGVITGGTGTAANINRPAAGKTGTGENFTNAWFVGYTPTLDRGVDGQGRWRVVDG